MKIYSISNEENAIQIKQLIRLSAECTRLQWSRNIKKIPRDVMQALERVEGFASERIDELCQGASYSYELSSKDEDDLMRLLKETPEIRDIIGSGVIMKGDESEYVLRYLKKKEKVSKELINSVRHAKCTIIF